MKKAVALLLLPFFAHAGASSNSESNSISSGANINNQTVVNENNFMVIDDVRCPKPTVTITTAAARLENKVSVDQFHVGVALSIPIITNDCNKAVNYKLKMMSYQLKQYKADLKIKQDQHALRVVSACAELKAVSDIKLDICGG